MSNYLVVNGTSVEDDHEGRIREIHEIIAESSVAAAQPAGRLHSLHLRFGLSSTKRDKYWNSQSAKEFITASLYGVKCPPFGEATPNARMDLGLVPPHISEFFTGDELGSEYDVIIFRRPKPQKAE